LRFEEGASVVTDFQDPMRRVFAAADQLWTNSPLRPDQYAQPVLVLIALRQMEAKCEAVHAELAQLYKRRPRAVLKLHDQLSFNWRATQQRRTAVQSAIRFTLNELPDEPYRCTDPCEPIVWKRKPTFKRRGGSISRSAVRLS
jgi:hypothetical protein